MMTNHVGMFVFHRGPIPKFVISEYPGSEIGAWMGTGYALVGTGDCAKLHLISKVFPTGEPDGGELISAMHNTPTRIDFQVLRCTTSWRRILSCLYSTPTRIIPLTAPRC